MEHQDWTEVKWDKRARKGTHETKNEFLRREMKAGRVATVKKYTGSGMGNLEKKLDKADEDGKLSHKKLSVAISKRIAQRRAEKKMSQTELAMKINVNVNTIKEYEKPNSKIIPNARILDRIEKVLGTVRK